MMTATHFNELVNQAYDFLTQEYGFAYVGVQETPRQIFVTYRKAELMVFIKYSHTNLYIEVAIYNYVPAIPPPEYQLKDNVMLIHLIKRENPDFDYNSVMPNVISLENAVMQTANLLKYYGASILSSQEWVNWKDIVR
jgi:hypothetical protein